MVSSSPLRLSADYSDHVPVEDDDDLHFAVTSAMATRNLTIPIPKRTVRSNDGVTAVQEYQLIPGAELEEALERMIVACTEGGILNLKNYGLRLTEFAAATAAGKRFQFCVRTHAHWHFTSTLSASHPVFFFLNMYSFCST